MKNIMIFLFAAMVLSSCNTTIGVGRDIRDGYRWTKGKIDQSRNNSEGYDQGPPVY